MKYKAGDRVKVTEVLSIDGKYGLKVNDVGFVTSHNGGTVYYVDFINGIFKGRCGTNIDSDGTYQMFGYQLELAKDEQEITIKQKGRKVIAVMTEGGKYIKSANAKCNPTDVFDFNVGAKLAFRRLMGEDTILVVNPNEPALPTFDWDDFKHGKFAVHCDTEEKAKAFLKECDEQGIRWSSGQKASSMTEYSSYGCETAYCCYFKDGLQFSAVNWYKASGITDIFKYQPPIREVKRPAKVGEWIKIVDSAHPKCYQNGEIYQVVGLQHCYADKVGASINKMFVAMPEEYVVLENYQPEAKPFFSQSTIDEISRYTDKELINELSRRWEDKQ